jgi:sugar/nucleoside kinase (ribokinase family)
MGQGSKKGVSPRPPQVVAIGSVALDTIETPHGRRGWVLGGSATHFSMAARHFARVGAVGVVGDDFPPEHLETLRRLKVDTRGIHREKGLTFRWHGRYSDDMNSRTTISVELGVFAAFQPKIPPDFRKARYALLGNSHPASQRALLEQLDAFAMLDTMDLWISNERAALLKLLPRVAVLCINAEEALLLTGEANLAKAIKGLLRLGPRAVIVKKAEHGAILAARDMTLALSAFLTETVVDPTGAGDSFAGGLMGYLASVGRVDFASLRKAVQYGAVAASFNVEGYSLDRIREVGRADLDRRMERYLIHLQH